MTQIRMPSDRTAPRRIARYTVEFRLNGSGFARRATVVASSPEEACAVVAAIHGGSARRVVGRAL